MSQTTLKHLVNLAEAAVKCSVPDEASVKAIADYCDSFDDWFKGFNPSQAVDVDSADLLRKLEALHPQVLKTAQLLLDQTSDSLRKIKVRGKTILAYAEVMPQQIGPFGLKK